MLKVFRINGTVADVSPRVSERSKLGGIHRDGGDQRDQVTCYMIDLFSADIKTMLSM